MKLHILSGGAAQGAVRALAPKFEAETGYEIAGSFGAVGAMKEKLLAGEPADIMILTRKLVDELAASGKIEPDSCADLGRVRTGVAVKQGAPIPDVSDADGLRAALLAADSVYFPDPQRATAGIHFAKVLDALGVRGEISGRLRPHPNGATAMREMAEAPEARPLGCTQITEILYTPGVALVAPLPAEFELATVYTAGVCRGAAEPQAARRFVALLTGGNSRELREQAGFELPA
jgi:molybdate transport system substrate-binding protein